MTFDRTWASEQAWKRYWRWQQNIEAAELGIVMPNDELGEWNRGIFERIGNGEMPSRELSHDGLASWLSWEALSTGWSANTRHTIRIVSGRIGGRRAIFDLLIAEPPAVERGRPRYLIEVKPRVASWTDRHNAVAQVSRYRDVLSEISGCNDFETWIIANHVAEEFVGVDNGVSIADSHVFVSLIRSRGWLDSGLALAAAS